MVRNRLGACALTLLASFLLSCGGGGGGGSSSSSGGANDRLTFTADRASIAFEYMEGNGNPPQEVSITAAGKLPDTLYIGAVVEGTGINPAIEIFISGSTALFRISHSVGLAEGTYTGRIRLMGCSDQACSRQIGNSPVILNYTVRVQPRLGVTPGLVNLDAVSGNSASADITVKLPWQQTTATATVFSADGEWLSILALSPNTFRLTARTMPSGTRNATVRISSGGYDLNLPVTYVTTAPPGGEFDLRSNPTSFTFAATENTVATPATVTVLGPTWKPDVPVRSYVGYTGPNSSEPWLTVDEINGGYRVTADARVLRAGNYTAILYFEDTDPDTTSTHVEIPVAFTVGEGIVRPADIDITLDSNTTSASSYLSGTVPINLTAGPQIQWTASSSQSSWVRLTRDEGDTGTSLQYEVDLAGLNLASNYRGDDTVYITVTPSEPIMLPITFQVRLHRRVAYIDYITPRLRVFGRQTRHIVRGGGFIAGRDWAQELEFYLQGSGAAQVTRVNDSELIVDVAPNQPNVSIYASNELGFYTPGAVLTNLPVWNFSYEAVPTGFTPRKLLQESQGQSLWLVDENNGLGLLRSYYATTLTGSWFAATQYVVPGLRDVMRGVDGRLYILSTQGLHTWDSGNVSFPQGFTEPLYLPSYGNAMSMTNDGRLWFAIGSASNRGLGSLPAYWGQMARVQSPLLAPTDGPSFAVSRNGERLYLSQSNAPGGPPLLALDAAAGPVYTAPNQGLTHLEWASMSDDAGRLIAQDFQVRDAQLNVIGHVNVTQNNYMSVAANVSTDGSRAYVLAYERGELTAPSPQALPRVYVFDLTTAGSAGQQMPLLGYFTFADYPTCLRGADCSLRPESALNEVGNTLFYAGNRNLVIVPVPAENALLSAQPPAGKLERGIVTKRMR
jgi:hypothetical protein